jgi:hypothetical protein
MNLESLGRIAVQAMERLMKYPVSGAFSISFPSDAVENH